ncbi:MAG: M23 family metallopeptidase [Lewinellaceae bacterium]|nr:M23 family metallopeptidase [Lewinellaceae bacterium]
MDGSWDAASTDAYNAFWQAHTLDNSFDHAGTAAPADDRLRFIIDEYNDHGFTNDAGILNIRVPMAFLADKKVRLEIGFFEFPVVLEKRKLDATDTHAITRRLNPLGTLSEDDTGFIIRWEGQDAQGNVIQTTDWDRNKNWDNTAVSPQKGHFGWQVEDVPDVPSAENTDFLRVCLKLPIKDDFQPYAGLNANLLSNFYDANTYPYHFVVFGMQWCQPMWQLLPATTTHWVEGPIHPGNDVPLGLSTQINPDERTKPAICTMYDAAADRSGQGRDYGANVFYHGQTGSQGTPVNDTTHFTPAELPLVFKLLDFGPTRYYAPRSRGHHGIDYHAINHTTPVFAPYGSKVIFASRINGYGKVLQFKVEKSGNIFLMAHLSENHNYAVALNDVVMAGRHVARAGRTDSNTVMNSYYTDGPTTCIWKFPKAAAIIAGLLIREISFN